MKADPAKHGAARLVCNQSAFHSGGFHLAGASGWMWRRDRPGALMAPARRYRPEIVRRWVCRGWIPEQQRYCGDDWIGTEDAARVKGWRIRTWNGDQLCPACGRPDPETVRLCRDLERSVKR